MIDDCLTVSFCKGSNPHWEAAHNDLTVKDTKPLNAEGQRDNAD